MRAFDLKTAHAKGKVSIEPSAPIRSQLMFLSPRNDEHRPEDIQQLIINSSAAVSPSRSSPSAAPTDMESGGGARVSTSSDQRAAAHKEVDPAASGHGGSLWSRYFSLPVLLLVGVTASLVILPLVLPPLPPPPSMLMLVPVAMLVLLLVLAFMPTTSSVRGGTTGPTYM